MSERASASSASRSEEVRQRRSRQSKDRMKKAATSSTRAKRPAAQKRYSAVAPTIFARGGMGTPVVRRTQSRVKRKVAIPLDSPGAELQMPALPVVRLGWRLLSFFLVILLGAALYMAMTRPELQVGVPQVEGLKRLSADELDAVTELEGLPIFMVDPARATEEIKAAFPELQDVSVEIVLPATVKITAMEREPVLAWKYNKQTLWMDAEGAIFPARGEPDGAIITVKADSLPPLLPVILPNTGDTTTTGQSVLESQKPPELSLSQRQVDPKLMEGIQTLSAEMPDGTMLIYSESEGMGWNDPNGWRAYVGKMLDNLDLKMLVYNQIVDQLNKQDIRPVLVSVAQVDAPYYRLEQ